MLLKIQVKVSPLQAMKAGGGCKCTALWRCRVASPTLGRLYPGKSPRYSLYRRLSEPQDMAGSPVELSEDLVM